MFEYPVFLDSNFWPILGLALVSLASGCYFLSLAITGFHLSRISNLEPNKRYETYLMSLFQAFVCFLVFAKFLFPLYSDTKVLLSLFLFFFAAIARMYYWRNLSLYFNEPPIKRIFYNTVVITAVSLSLVHIAIYLFEGSGACCLAPDVINPTANILLKIQVPFRMSSLIQTYQKGYLLVVWVLYIHFFLKSLRQKDISLKVGLALSVLNIFYTASYFIFEFPYWVPIFFLVDIVEYTRMQKLQIYQLDEDFKGQRYRHQKLYENLSGPLQSSWIKLKDLLNKDKSSKNDLSVEKEVSSLYEATSSAIDILNKYNEIRGADTLVPVSDVVEKVLEIYDDVNIEYSPPSFEVSVHNAIVKNTLINLIKNSKEALGENFRWVKIKAFNYGNGVQLKYIDNGEFKDFSRPQEAFTYGVSSKYGSFRGIGLASIKADIESVNGRIELGPFHGNTCFDIFI